MNWKKFIGYSIGALGLMIIFASSIFSVIDYMFFDANKYLYLLGFATIALGYGFLYKSKR